MGCYSRISLTDSQPTPCYFTISQLLSAQLLFRFILSYFKLLLLLPINLCYYCRPVLFWSLCYS